MWNGGEQRRIHQGLELLIVALEVDLQVRAVGIDAGSVNGSLFDRAGTELLVKHNALEDGGQRGRRHRVGGFNAQIEIYSVLEGHGVARSQNALLDAFVVAYFCSL